MRISDWSSDVCSSDLEYLDAQPDVVDYVAQVSGFLDHWLPRLKTDTRSYVTVAFGCIGGRHRSVYLAETMAAHARGQGWPDVATYHPELDRPVPAAPPPERPWTLPPTCSCVHSRSRHRSVLTHPPSSSGATQLSTATPSCPPD